MNKNKKINFEVSERKILLKVFDVLFVLLALYSVGNLFNLQYLQSTTQHYYYIAGVGMYIISIGTIFEMYNLQVASNHFKVMQSTILTVSIVVLFYLLTPYFTAELPSNRFEIFIFYVTILLTLLSWRIFYVNFLASHRFVQKVLLVCSVEQLQKLTLELQNSDPHYKIVAYVNHGEDENKNALQNLGIEKVDLADLVFFVQKNKLFEVVVASHSTEEISSILYLQLLKLLESGTTIREYTQVYEDKTHRIPLQYIARDFYKFFPFNRINSNRIYLLHVRIMETIISISGLSIGIVLLPLILIGNLIGNRGNLFYTQERVGRNGKKFKILKFRTMVFNAEQDIAIFSSSNDGRITPFGKFMRKTRMDEFPQFINILKGEMAVIGPRPERPFFVKEISEIMPLYETRHVIRPGLTGWAQVNYSYGESIDDSLIKLQYDLYYIKHRSIFLDLRITFKTISTILFYRGQ